MQDHNILVHIVVNNETIATFEPCPFTNGNEYWDIGFVNPKMADFIEVNSFLDQIPRQRRIYLDFLLQFFKHLQRQNKLSLKKAFGINNILIS